MSFPGGGRDDAPKIPPDDCSNLGAGARQIVKEIADLSRFRRARRRGFSRERERERGTLSFPRGLARRSHPLRLSRRPLTGYAGSKGERTKKRIQRIRRAPTRQEIIYEPRVRVRACVYVCS